MRSLLDEGHANLLHDASGCDVFGLADGNDPLETTLVERGV